MPDDLCDIIVVVAAEVPVFLADSGDLSLERKPFESDRAFPRVHQPDHQQRPGQGPPALTEARAAFNEQHPIESRRRPPLRGHDFVGWTLAHHVRVAVRGAHLA